MIWTITRNLLCDVTPGMTLGRPVISETGKIIVSENTVLTEATINRLQSWGITTLYIKGATVDENEESVSFYAEQRQFLKKHEELVTDLANSFEKVRYFKEVPLAQIMNIAGRSVDTLISAHGVLSHLQSIRSTDDYTFRHSVNVGVIAGVLGKWLGFKGQKLRELVLSGLIHDIGKTQIPLEILNKPAKLTTTERDIMQEHATLGFELMKNTAKLPTPIMLGVWQHHERMDGSGYPFGIGGGDVSIYARLIAIADTYDAMVSNRVYKKGVTPFEVIKEIFAEMFSKLDPTISMTFLNNLKDTLIGYIVKLSDGSLAKVVYLDKNCVIQPVVKIASGEYIDLEKRKDIKIVEVVST